MDISTWVATIQGNTPALMVFMGSCLFIILGGAVVRAIIGAVDGGNSNDD